MNLLSLRFFLLLGLACVSLGCANQALVGLLAKPDPQLVEVAKLQPEDTQTQVRYPPTAVMALTQQMQAYAEQAVAGLKGDDRKVKALHHALIAPPAAGGLGISYQPLATLTAAQVFARREANCLSFSLLFVAMARYVGLAASLNDVQVPPTWAMNNERVQFMRHVNVKVDLRFSTDDIVVDLDMRNYRPYYPQTLIRDETAIAQYYNNLAMTMEPGDTASPRKLALMRLAISLADEQSYLWNNLATLYWRMGLPRTAEALYLQAAHINPEDLTVVWNLSEFYRSQHRYELAEALLQVVENYRDSNPYYQYRLAGVYFSEANYEQAARRIEAAIDKQPEETRFYRLAADIYEQMGLTRKQRQAQQQF
ncbi:tetratricopeptide repeat protein [Gilvimarinus sp. DA14]|uniref:tetratricopeptide repeat protein n=1 Tax=Gilvimarinus sp. DA14 TaxID=2956798 RepID=UPI0020B69BA7|nr:tetratricopeptide repeat protein [Gilvimarinus sp. DA14]UTF59341.1 tetratricopeptide repeat protein [Gilvimarinus sp. DA14]